MQKVRQVLLGLFVSLAVAIPLGVLAMNAQPVTHPVSIVHVASDNTPTPTPPGGGAPCNGGHC